MVDYSQQIDSIKLKLIEAKTADPDFRVFGAGSHKYELNPPANKSEVEAFEQSYKVILPDCYRAFVLHVGNGGKSYMNSGAGPFYGIYTLGEHLDQMVAGDPKSYLKNESPLYPNLSDDDWTEMSKILNDDASSDEVYYEELERIFGGILPIGSQGCTYLHGLLLNGPHKGKVINLELAAELKPRFTYENNFLDWYERWLDEIISGKLISKSPSWFGYGPADSNL
ncbi:SMI1/KNR4 family protein [Flagellimonas sp. 2504JD4-2]